MRQILAIFVPGGVLLLAAWAVQQEEVVRGVASPYAGYFCVCALLVAVLLSWYHDQSRFLSISGALALAVLGWVRLPAGAHSARLGILFLLPVIFVLAAVFYEQRVFTRVGALRLGLLAAAALAVVGMAAAKLDRWTLFLSWEECPTT